MIDCIATYGSLVFAKIDSLGKQTHICRCIILRYTFTILNVSVQTNPYRICWVLTNF